MHRTRLLIGPGVVSTILLLGCSAPQLPPPAPAPKPTATAAPAPKPAATKQVAAAEQLAAATPSTTRTGASFTIPKGWWLTRQPAFLALEGPERELKLWIVDIEESSLTAAIAAAWKRVKPTFALAVDNTQKPPARGGWDAIVQQSYVTPTGSGRVVVGNARRKGKVSYVVLIDASQKALSRRGAQLGQIFGGLKAPGQKEESFAGKTAHVLDDAKRAKLESFIEEARKLAEVPGAAVAVVQGDAIAWQRGFGVRDNRKPTKVTADTSFMIGSTTKSLTSLMMAKLIDEGLFRWDTPVTKLMPSFKLGDAAATKQITMRHTMCACTGLPRQDMEFLFEFDKVTAKMRFAELAKMKPTTGFGETFQYSNALVSAGGYVAAKAAYPALSFRAAYQKAMKTRVFDPIGMKGTTFDMKRATRSNHAIPHGASLERSYRALAVSLENAVVSVAPAGGAWSTVTDLARAMLVEMNQGKSASGKSIVGANNLLERHKPGVKISNKASYGLALTRVAMHGLQAISHGGNTLGFTCKWRFFPKARLGLVVLANAQGANTFTAAVERRLLELLYDGKAEAKENLLHAVKQRKEAIARMLAKVKAEPAWLARMAGRWNNADLGNLNIVVQGERLLVDAGEWKAEAAQKRSKDGVSTILFVGPPLVGVELLPQKDKLVLRAAQRKYVFEKK